MTVYRSKDDATSIVIVLCCLFLPPLGVLLLNGIGPEFIISICLTILGWIPGVIYAVWLWIRAGGLNDRTRSEARIERFKRKFHQRRAQEGQSAVSSAAASDAPVPVAGQAAAPAPAPAHGPATGAAPAPIPVPGPVTAPSPAPAHVAAPIAASGSAAPAHAAKPGRQSSDVARVDGSRLEETELTRQRRHSVPQHDGGAIQPDAAAAPTIPKAPGAGSPDASAGKSSAGPSIPIIGNLLKRRNAKRVPTQAQTVPAYPTRRVADDPFTPLPPLGKTAPLSASPATAAAAVVVPPAHAGVIETVREASHESAIMPAPPTKSGAKVDSKAVASPTAHAGPATQGKDNDKDNDNNSQW